jgi:antitoxin component of RelBE/YafQ-DinJ toxin-antitoxin module
MSPIKTKFFQLRIEEELKERAEKAAQRKGLSLASLFRLYLIEGLEQDERKWVDRGSGKN